MNCKVCGRVIYGHGESHEGARYFNQVHLWTHPKCKNAPRAGLGQRVAPITMAGFVERMYTENTTITWNWEAEGH